MKKIFEKPSAVIVSLGTSQCLCGSIVETASGVNVSTGGTKDQSGDWKANSKSAVSFDL